MNNYSEFSWITKSLQWWNTGQSQLNVSRQLMMMMMINGKFVNNFFYTLENLKIIGIFFLKKQDIVCFVVGSKEKKWSLWNVSFSSSVCQRYSTKKKEKFSEKYKNVSHFGEFYPLFFFWKYLFFPLKVEWKKKYLTNSFEFFVHNPYHYCCCCC